MDLVDLVNESSLEKVLAVFGQLCDAVQVLVHGGLPFPDFTSIGVNLISVDGLN